MRSGQVDGKLPAQIECPRTPAETAEILRRARADRLGIIVLGGGTAVDIGNVPERYHLSLDMCQMDEIGEHSAPDMVVTAAAGTTLAALNARLARANQVLPIDAPLEATLGGIVAGSQAGKRRLSRGTVRDWLIGARAITGSGRNLRAGAKVVKNVAGYDLLKLLCGSGGTLAVLTELSFKVAPRPQSSVQWQIPCDNLACVQTIRHAAMPLRPSWLELRSRQDGRFEVEVGLEGDQVVVAWQSERLVSQVPQAREVSEDSPTSWPLLPQRPRVSAPTSEVRFRLATHPEALLSLLAEGFLGAGFGLTAHLGSGIAEVTGSPTQETLEAWKAAVEATGGWWRLETGPKTLQECFGPRRDEWEIARRIKELFDPVGILSPGRAPGRF